MNKKPRNIQSPVEMVDISQKPVVSRMAEAVGDLRLRPETLKAIEHEQIKKGDPFAVAEIAGILAAKKTPDTIPLCHHVPLSHVSIKFEVAKDHITSRCSVLASYKTGVEMEALIGVTTSLLTIWDMVKYLEKNGKGQYPYTRISNVRVTEKKKGK